MLSIRSARLSLRALTLTDLDDLTFLLPNNSKDPVIRYQERLDTSRWLEAIKKVDPSEGGAWAITHLITNKVLGLILYGDFQPRSGRVTISYGLQPEARGKGYAKEALCSAIDYILNISLIVAVVADIDPLNVKSLRLVNSMGFMYRPDEEAKLLNGCPADRYVLSREDVKRIDNSYSQCRLLAYHAAPRANSQ